MEDLKKISSYAKVIRASSIFLMSLIPVSVIITIIIIFFYGLNDSNIPYEVQNILEPILQVIARVTFMIEILLLVFLILTNVAGKSVMNDKIKTLSKKTCTYGYLSIGLSYISIIFSIIPTLGSYIVFVIFIAQFVFMIIVATSSKKLMNESREKGLDKTSGINDIDDFSGF